MTDETIKVDTAINSPSYEQDSIIQSSSEEQDSIEWGTPSKGGAKKVYGDLNKAPLVMGMKILRMKISEEFAMGGIQFDEYKRKMALTGVNVE